MNDEQKSMVRYSTDDMTYSLETAGDALDELDSCGELVAGRVYCEAEIKPIGAKHPRGLT